LAAVRFVRYSVCAVLPLALAGCGDGGSGTVASTPVPPTSGSTGTNTSLQSLSVNQSFSNNAVAASASYPSSGGNGTVVQATNTALTISYEAATQTYVVSANGTSQSFSTGGATPPAAGAQLLTQKNGATTDTLTLYNSAPVSNAMITQYVQAGYWQHTTQGASTVGGSLDAFTYGISTSDANVPRSGQAGYDLALNAVFAAPYQQPTASTATGTMLVDFSTGAIGFTGGGGFTAFGGSATLASGSNSVTGTIDLAGATGTLAGRFYGPQANEFGATFDVNASDGSTTVGTLIGYQDPSILTAGQGVTSGAALSSMVYATVPNVAAPEGNFAWDTQRVQYAPATSTYTLAGPGVTGLSVGPAQMEAAQSDPRFVAYDTTQGTATARVLIYTSGAANPDLALTYASFADVTVTQHDANGNVTGTAEEYTPFGVMTPLNQMPRTGTANYSGAMYGSGVDTQTSHAVGVTGSFAMTFSPDSVQQITMTFNPTVKDITTGTVLESSNGISMNALLDTSDAGFQTVPIISGGHITAAYGAFYGPNANEVAGIWLMPIGTVNAAGVMVGKKN
jgi:hypothetical protein